MDIRGRQLTVPWRIFEAKAPEQIREVARAHGGDAPMDAARVRGLMDVVEANSVAHDWLEDFWKRLGGPQAASACMAPSAAGVYDELPAEQQPRVTVGRGRGPSPLDLLGSLGPYTEEDRALLEEAGVRPGGERPEDLQKAWGRLHAGYQPTTGLRPDVLGAVGRCVEAAGLRLADLLVEDGTPLNGWTSLCRMGDHPVYSLWSPAGTALDGACVRPPPPPPVLAALGSGTPSEETWRKWAAARDPRAFEVTDEVLRQVLPQAPLRAWLAEPGLEPAWLAALLRGAARARELGLRDVDVEPEALLSPGSGLPQLVELDDPAVMDAAARLLATRTPEQGVSHQDFDDALRALHPDRRPQPVRPHQHRPYVEAVARREATQDGLRPLPRRQPPEGAPLTTEALSARQVQAQFKQYGALPVVPDEALRSFGSVERLPVQYLLDTYGPEALQLAARVCELNGPVTRSLPPHRQAAAFLQAPVPKALVTEETVPWLARLAAAAGVPLPQVRLETDEGLLPLDRHPAVPPELLGNLPRVAATLAAVAGGGSTATRARALQTLLGRGADCHEFWELVPLAAARRSNGWLPPVPTQARTAADRAASLGALVSEWPDAEQAAFLLGMFTDANEQDVREVLVQKGQSPERAERLAARAAKLTRLSPAQFGWVVEPLIEEPAWPDWAAVDARLGTL